MQELREHFRIQILLRFTLMFLIVKHTNSFVPLLSCYVQAVQEERPKRQRVSANCHGKSPEGSEVW
jgi:hypothetical protein